jgi:hypothetical protein
VRLVWTPEEGEKREFSFRPNKLMSVEAELIESLGGEAWETFDEFGRLFMKGNRRAYRAALFVLLKRTEPGRKFRDLNLRADEIAVDYEDDELAQILARVELDDDIDPEQRELLIASLGEQASVPKAQPSEPSQSETVSGTEDAPTAG